MDIFISWSGKRSGAAAEALRNWLPLVINAAKPFLSASDVDKGARWGSEVSSKLKDSNFGIICLTPGNLETPWILFEAGALSKAVETARVCTFLIDLRPADVKWPLGQFQHTTTEKVHVLKLLAAINSALGSDAIPGQQLEEAFELLWPRLESKLGQLPKETATASPERSDRELLEEILEFIRAQARTFVTLGSERAVTAFVADLIDEFMHAAGIRMFNLDIASGSSGSTTYLIRTTDRDDVRFVIPSSATIKDTIDITKNAVAAGFGIREDVLPDFDAPQ